MFKHNRRFLGIPNRRFARLLWLLGPIAMLGTNACHRNTSTVPQSTVDTEQTRSKDASNPHSNASQIRLDAKTVWEQGMHHFQQQRWSDAFKTWSTLEPQQLETLKTSALSCPHADSDAPQTKREHTERTSAPPTHDGQHAESTTRHASTKDTRSISTINRPAFCFNHPRQWMILARIRASKSQEHRGGAHQSDTLDASTKHAESPLYSAYDKPAGSPPPLLHLEAVGDVLMGMGWPEHRKRLPKNPAQIFQHVAPELGDAHITFGNLETVLNDDADSTKCPKKSNRCYAFRVPGHYAQTLKKTGFTVMSIANNHSGDFGTIGRQTTMQNLDAVAIRHSGVLGDIASWQQGPLRIALIAFSTGEGLYRVQHIEEAVQEIQALDRDHDLVIASFHGGAEGTKAAHVPNGVEMFYGENRGHLRAFTHALIDAGADLILGHGPHLWRGMEVYRSRLIVYSMGNFSAWRNLSLKGPLALTAILDVRLFPDGILHDINLDPYIIRDPGIPTSDPQARVIGWVRNLSEQDFGDPLLDPQGYYLHDSTHQPIPPLSHP